MQNNNVAKDTIQRNELPQVRSDFLKSTKTLETMPPFNRVKQNSKRYLKNANNLFAQDT